MNKESKHFLNSLRCPICSSQIDLIDWAYSEKTRSGFNFGCASNAEHYSILYIHWDNQRAIARERVVVYDNSKQYTIHQEYDKDKLLLFSATEIRIKDVDQEFRIIEGSGKKLIVFDKHIFNFQKQSKDNIINRIKTILVFQ